MRLAESLIKEMTGGDKLAARFMRGEFFEFMRSSRSGLRRTTSPTIRGDAAIWSRLKLVPFDDTIPKDQQKPAPGDGDVPGRRLPGILNWAIEGCLEWQRDGLGVRMK